MVWAARRPLCDVIANSILQKSDVREAGQVVTYTAALSNVQKSTVSRNPHNTVVKLRPYLLDFVS